jgi:hypothetical protein
VGAASSSTSSSECPSPQQSIHHQRTASEKNKKRTIIIKRVGRKLFSLRKLKAIKEVSIPGASNQPNGSVSEISRDVLSKLCEHCLSEGPHES